MDEKTMFDNLTDEQKAKLLECKTQEELFAFSKEVGVEISQDQLEAIAAGGKVCKWHEC